MVMAKDGENGINGGLMKRKMPGQPFANYVTVDSIDQMLSAANASGARTALPKQEIGGGMGWIAAFLDPENNLIGLHQIGPNAQRPAAAKKAPVAKAAASGACREESARREEERAQSGEGRGEKARQESEEVGPEAPIGPGRSAKGRAASRAGPSRVRS